MPQKLTHLPTKRTTVKATKTRPYVRRQHYNPNEDPKSDRQRGAQKPDQQENQPKTEISAKLRPMRTPEQQHQPYHAQKKKLNDQEAATSPKSDELKRGEEVMTASIPEELSKDNKLEKVGVESANGVYTFVGDDDWRFYWKPANEENIGRKNNQEPIRDTISGNFSGREVAAYHLSKMLGAETLVPPTTTFGHQMHPGEKGWYEGSAQMSAHDFANKILGHKSVKTPVEIREKMDTPTMMEKTKNASDLILFDFIQGNTDRHGGNFFLSKHGDGDFNAIAIDNGLAFPEHRGDIIHPDGVNTLGLMKQYFKSQSRWQPINDKFMEGVMSFDADAFQKMAKSNGIPDIASKGVVDRVKMVQDKIKSNYMNAVELSSGQDFESIEDRRAWLKEQVRFSGDDLADIFREKYMSEFDEHGNEKYAGAFGEWYDPADWIKELEEVIGDAA